MKLLLIRKIKTDKSTIGELYVNDKFICYTLEDRDRGLKQSDSLTWIKLNKIYGETCIPSGTYDLVLSYSNRFKKYLPEIRNVKGFEGIRIHVGNSAQDSSGCPLVGDTIGDDFIGRSRVAFDKLMPLLIEAEKTEKITIEIADNA